MWTLDLLLRRIEKLLIKVANFSYWFTSQNAWVFVSYIIGIRIYIYIHIIIYNIIYYNNRSWDHLQSNLLVYFRLNTTYLILLLCYCFPQKRYFRWDRIKSANLLFWEPVINHSTTTNQSHLIFIHSTLQYSYSTVTVLRSWAKNGDNNSYVVFVPNFLMSHQYFIKRNVVIFFWLTIKAPNQTLMKKLLL